MMDCECVSKVTDYRISPQYAFLGEDLPLTRLPSYFSEWEALLQNLPEAITRRTLREEVRELPDLIFNEETLKSELEWRRAYLMLSYLGQGYIWMEGEEVMISKLPSKIAVPWASVSKHLGLKPVGSYSSTVLFNYGIKDASLPRDLLKNVYALHTFTGFEDEKHFYLIHVLMEMASAPAIQAAGQIHNLMLYNDNISIKKRLKIIQESVIKVQEVVNGMYDGCNKGVFYNEIRPFFAAKKTETSYEGVNGCSDLHGATAAQSSGMFALSILFGVKLSDRTRPFMTTMMDYMPAPHRDFLKMLKEKPSFRDYCQASGDSALIEHFDEVVEELVKFRSQHINLVASYIVNQAKREAIDGTGGAAHAVVFLKDIRDRTIEAKLVPKK